MPMIDSKPCHKSCICLNDGSIANESKGYTINPKAFIGLDHQNKVWNPRV